MGESVDTYFMARALRLAENGLYSTDPNPSVGCVLVREGKIIGSGFHLLAGHAHAEAAALAEAGSSARGATAYVTMEPCSFTGRTPSCARALIDAGIVRVVSAMTDPDPRNAGRGFTLLRQAGIDVTTPLMEGSARALNPGHVSRYERGRPWVRLKLAMSLDGKTALSSGESRWITGEAARRDVQRLRARSAAIVTGAGTVVDDDPGLDLRADQLDVPWPEAALARQRPVYVLDAGLRVPATARVLQKPENVLVCGRRAGDSHRRESYRCRILETDTTSDGRVDLNRFLAGLGCGEVLFECGATLAGSLLEAGLCDELVIYMAPKLMGASARSLLQLAEIDNMGDLMNLRIVDFRFVGEDIRIIATPIHNREP